MNTATFEACRKTREDASVVLANAQKLLEKLDRSDGRLRADFPRSFAPATGFSSQRNARHPHLR